MILIIKHIEIEGPGTLEDFFKETDWQIKVVELEHQDILPPLDDCEAIISLGGPMNVYETEKYHFLTVEEDFLKEALKKEVPILGICLGAQLLAKVSGAKVQKAKQEEAGWYKVNLTEEGRKDNLFRGLNGSLDVFQWHEDTFDIPQHGVLLATSTSCNNQAMKIGKNAWGLQFHLELTDNMLKKWLDYYPVSFDKEKMILEYFDKKNIYDKEAKLIYLNFNEHISYGAKRRK